MANTDVKKRNWAFVAYPESLPADWLDQLQATGLQIAISPLHDSDLDPTGEPKKPHYHVILCYSGPTSYRIVKRLTDAFNQPSPKPLEQVKGYYRYFTHKDNPEKHQYDDNEILTLNGFNILDYADLTASELASYKKQLIKLIKDLDLYEYSDFVDFLSDNDMDTEFRVAAMNTLFFDRYLSSRRYKRSPVEDRR